MTPPSLILLGVISSAHGVRGQVKIRSFTADPASLFNYSPFLNKAGQPLFHLQKNGEAGGQFIASITGVTTREAAEKLKNTELYTLKSNLPALAESEFYIEDLIGMAVHVAGIGAYGTVKAVHNFGAGDMLEILPDTAKDTELFAFTHANFPHIDTANNLITFTPPEHIDAEDKP